MSWKSALGKLAIDFGEDVARRVADLLPKEATVAEARRVARSEAAKAAAKKPNLAARPLRQDKPKSLAAAPAVIKGRAGSPKAVAQDVFREAASPSKGAPSFAAWRAENPETGRLFDFSNLSVVPNVPQTQMPRYAAPRGPSARIVEALANPEVERGINETVQRGIEGGGLQWYNTEPMRERLAGAVPSIDVDPTYARLMDIVAATSPRSRVPDNIRTASYYNYLLSQGLPVPPKPAKGYGSVAQELHRSNIEGLAERGGWDVFQNPKPASFSTNLQGNQQNVTIDTHNFRLPGILSGDPRFLETSVAELAKTPESALESLRRHYPNLPEDVAASAVKVAPGKGGDARVSMTYRPQEWAAKGYISPEEAAADPAIWAPKPKPNEYGYYENWQQEQARKLGISPAQYQASMWLGGGDTTGLGSAAEPFVGTFEARVRYTADRLGLDPDKVLEMMLRGEIPLLSHGGPVSKPSLAVKAA